MTKCAIYVRVSKEEEEAQDPENQLQVLINWAKSLGYEVCEEYIFVDRASGGDSNRPAFQKMLSLASQHRFSVVLVWALDRFSRESILNTFSYIEKLKKANVGLKSYQESWLDTTQEGISELLLAIFSWVAKFERERISQRIKTALQRRKNLGMKLGRPRKTPPSFSSDEKIS